MYVNLREWREEIPWTQIDLHLKTRELGSSVSISTIQAAERGEHISRIKARALLNALNDGLQKRGIIQQPLQLENIEELQIA